MARGDRGGRGGQDEWLGVHCLLEPVETEDGIECVILTAPGKECPTEFKDSTATAITAKATQLKAADFCSAREWRVQGDRSTMHSRLRLATCRLRRWPSRRVVVRAGFGR